MAASCARRSRSIATASACATWPVNLKKYLLRLDRLGIIELRPLNRYRLKIAKGFRWHPNGPVMKYFREHVVDDYFSSGFDGDGETLLLVHGQISAGQAAAFVERLQRVGQDFAQQHLADQKLSVDRKAQYTLVVGMRTWLFTAFRDLKREPDGPAIASTAAAGRR